MLKTMNIGIDHGYYAIETRHFSFLAGIAVYSHEPLHPAKHAGIRCPQCLDLPQPGARHDPMNRRNKRNRFAGMSGCLLPMLRWNVCWAEVHR